MDATALNTVILSLLGLVVFFYLLHTTVRSAVRRGISDARGERPVSNRGAVPADE